MIDAGVESHQAVPKDGGRRAVHLRVLLPRAAGLAALTASRVHGARVRMGERLAEESPVDADLVLPIPDSGTPAAIGFSRALKIPFSEGLIKNRYVGRTFIQPDQGLREQGIRLKFNPLAEVAGQARRRGRRLDRARQHDAPDRADAVRRRRCRGARARLVAAGDLAVLLRHRLRRPRRAHRLEQDRRRGARVHRRDVTRVPVAGGSAGVDPAARLAVLPRVPHAGLPDRGPARGTQAAIRGVYEAKRPVRAADQWRGCAGNREVPTLRPAKCYCSRRAALAMPREIDVGERQRVNETTNAAELTARASAMIATRIVARM